MSAKKPQSSRVSPSKRNEGSKPKPKTTRVSPSARKEGSKPVAPKKPIRIEESGVTAASIAKLAGAAIKSIRGAGKAAKPKAKPNTSSKMPQRDRPLAPSQFKKQQKAEQLRTQKRMERETSQRRKAEARREATDRAERLKSGERSNFRYGPRGREVRINGRWVRD